LLLDRFLELVLPRPPYAPDRDPVEPSRYEPHPFVHADSNLIAFDRAATTLLPMGQSIRDASPERARAIIRDIVERPIEGGEVVGIAVRDGGATVPRR